MPQAGNTRAHYEPNGHVNLSAFGDPIGGADTRVCRLDTRVEALFRVDAAIVGMRTRPCQNGSPVRFRIKFAWRAVKPAWIAANGSD